MIRSRVQGCPLTKRELDVIAKLADGKLNKVIAWELGVSRHAVKTRLDRARKETKTRTLPALVALSIREGWIS